MTQKPIDVDDPTYKIGQELPQLPYETLYVRCSCGRLGLAAAIWAEFGSVLSADGEHSLSSCPAPGNLPSSAQELRKQLGDPLPGGNTP